MNATDDEGTTALMTAAGANRERGSIKFSQRLGAQKTLA